VNVTVNGEPVPETSGNALVRDEGIPGGHVACDTAIGGLRAEAEDLRAKVARYENAITWNTSCLACPAVLDSVYAETCRAEAAEGKLAAFRSPEAMLREFHASLNVHGGLMPEAPTADIPLWVSALRRDLLDEEVSELRDAMKAGDIVKIADGIADVVYVAVGTAVAYGVPFDAVFAEVHRSNMTKDNDPAKGKLVKGPGYSPPRIAEVLGLES